MIFDPGLLPYLSAPDALPETTHEAVLTLRYTDTADAKAEAAALDDLLQVMMPLFQAGFLATDGRATPKASVTTSFDGAQRLQITLSGLAHAPVMLHLMLRLIWQSYQTPASAFQDLVAMLGSEEEAREIFAGRTFGEVVAAVALTAKGAGQVPFDTLSVARPPEHAALVARVGPAPRNLDVAVAVTPQLTAPVEHAFLTGHNMGLLGPEIGLADAEPEIWSSPDGDGAIWHVRDYAGDPSYLVELLYLVLAADLSRDTGVDLRDDD